MSQIRANKRRQLIVVTHNPNIVPHADARLMQVMERGREAFHRRYKRLQEGPTHV